MKRIGISILFLGIVLLSACGGGGGGGSSGDARGTVGSSGPSGFNVDQGQASSFTINGWSRGATPNSVSVTGCPNTVSCIIDTTHGISAPILRVYTTMSSPPGSYQVRVFVRSIRQCFFGICSGGDVKSDVTYALTIRESVALFRTSFRHYETGDRPRQLALADLNGDGHIDVVTVNSAGLYGFGDSSLSVLHGDGTGGFKEKFKLYKTRRVYGVNVADLNADGWNDIVAVATFNREPEIRLSFGNADGTYLRNSNYELHDECGAVFAPKVADTDGNGTLDLIVGCNQSGVGGAIVLAGAGNGVFGEPKRFIAGSSNTRGFDVGDVNGDGIVDLAFINYRNPAVGNFSPNVVVLYGDGIGGFSISAEWVFSVAELNFVELADINGDNVLDLILTHNIVSVLQGKGNGEFLDANPWPAGYTPVATATGDVNNDGRTDIVVANSGSGSATFLINNGGGFSPVFSVTVGRAPYGIGIADCNEDGRPDLVLTNWNQGTISVVLNEGA